jgi:4-amino-4-deoxy-L-arabinose transferase-like glycosyltransferase
MKALLHSRWRWVALLLALLVLGRLLAMAGLPLMDTTEARYADIGRRMAELGDWVTPWHDLGQPFWGKPPLSFWLTAASFRLFGFTEFAARLPHFLCMLGVVALVARLARNRDEAWTTVALLGGAVLPLVAAGAVMTDEALVLGTTLAMVSFWRALHAPADQARNAGWWFFVALAVGLLAKGPLALVLTGLPLVAWVLLTRRFSAARRALPWGPGLVLMAALALPWYALAEHRTPGFLAYFIVGEHWHRFVTPGWQGDLYGTAHRFPPGAIWAFAVVAVLPWSVLTPLAAWRHRRGGGAVLEGPGADATPLVADHSRVLYLACWALAPLVFFTAARNIIWTYALPALPALALLGAGFLLQRVGKQATPRWLALGLALTLLAGVAGVVELREGGDMARRSSRELVARWLQAGGRLDGVGGPALVIVGQRQFSASFYSHGQARHAERAEDVAAQVPPGPAGAVVALGAGHEAELPQAQRLGQIGHYLLVLLTGPPSAPRAPG